MAKKIFKVVVEWNNGIIDAYALNPVLNQTNFRVGNTPEMKSLSTYNNSGRDFFKSSPLTKGEFSLRPKVLAILEFVRDASEEEAENLSW